jgi:hypothetical protein
MHDDKLFSQTTKSHLSQKSFLFCFDPPGRRAKGLNVVVIVFVQKDISKAILMNLVSRFQMKLPPDTIFFNIWWV